MSMKYIVYHKSNSKFDKFDLKFKSQHSSKKFGIGFNFSFEPLHDMDLTYSYKCEVELNNPITKDKDVISPDQWKEFVKEVQINLYGEEDRLLNNDFFNYCFLSSLYNGDNSKFVDAAVKILKVDGLIDNDYKILVSFNSNNIKILEVTKNVTDNDIEESKKVIEKQLGIDYDTAKKELKEIVEQALKWNNIEIVIDDLDFYGSRRFGGHKDDSDLDVALFYHDKNPEKKVREDDLFTILNSSFGESYDEPLTYRGFTIDFNPHKDFTETDIENYLKGSAEYRQGLKESEKPVEYLYHWSTEKFDTFKNTSQGIHLAKDLKTCKDLAKNRNLDFSKGYLYKVYLNKNLNDLNVLYFNLDPMLWDARNISMMLINKINNLPISAASEGTDDENSNWKDTNSGDSIHSDKFDKSDLDTLFEIRKSNKFEQIADFLRNKGYDLISYSNYGESSEGRMSYILFDDSLIKKIERVSTTLTEDTRGALISKSRSAGLYKDRSVGKNRFERRTKSKIANAVAQYNKINMDDLFKKDILKVDIPVVGETDNYLVSIKFEGVVDEIRRELKMNKNKLEYKIILQSISKVFSSSNVYVKCTCDDYKYRFSHWNIVNNVSVDDNSKDPGPGKNIANPNDDLGRGCKHVLLVLSNCDWIMKVASVINNYIHYMAEKYKKVFLRLIFPKLYGMTQDDIVDNDLLDEDSYGDILKSDEDIINIINEYGKNRGKITKGSNRNTAKVITDKNSD